MLERHAHLALRRTVASIAVVAVVAPVVVS
jgi:hypothetical protein